MAIVSCPACDKKLKVADTSVGKKVKCSCGNIFIAMAEAPAPVAAAVPDKVMVSCTECGANLKVASTSLGKKMKCPKCAAVFVAALDEEPPLAAPIKKAAPPVAEEFEDEDDAPRPAPKVNKKDEDDLFAFGQEETEEETPSKSKAKKKSGDEGEFEDEAPRSKGNKKAADDDEAPSPRAKGAKPPAMKDDAEKPIYPSRILANIFVTLLLLAYAAFFVLVFVFDFDTYMPPSKILGQSGRRKEIKTDPDTEKNKKELAKFDGVWTVESAAIDGSPDPDLKGKTVTFAEGQVTTPKMKGPFSVDVSKDPKWIEAPGPDDLPIPGIYKLDDNTLTWCMSIAEKAQFGGKDIWKIGTRPETFDAKKAVLLVLKRQEKKEDSKNGGVDNKKEAAKLDGVWIIQSLALHGKTQKDFEGAEYVFANGMVTFPGSEPGPFSVDAGKDPKTIDMAASKELTFLGIYQLDGDKLQLCTNEFKAVKKDGKAVLESTPRPTKFDSSQGPLYVFTRKKDAGKKPDPEIKKNGAKDKDFNKDSFKDKDFGKDELKDKDFKKDGFKDKDLKDKPGLRAPVEGTVLLDGRPMRSGEIWFVPAGKPATKLTIMEMDGTFSGLAAIGRNRVEIYLFKDGPPSATDPKVATKINVIHPKYSGPQSSLVVDVADRVNDFKFAVLSGNDDGKGETKGEKDKNKDKEFDRSKNVRDLDPALIAAWEKAGAKLVWHAIDERRGLVLENVSPKDPAALPGFYLGTSYKPGLIAKLPAPSAPFSLDLIMTGVKDEGLNELAGLQNLHGLSLFAQPVTSAGLKDLGRVKSLRALNLHATDLTGGVKDLAGLRNLQVLDISLADIGEARLKEISVLASLQYLNISKTGATDAVLKELAGLANLRHLDLSSTSITDASVPELARLKALRVLNVERTDVTPRHRNAQESPARSRTLIFSEFIVVFVGCFLARPMHVGQPMFRQLLAHGSPIQSQPLRGKDAIALQAPHQFLQQRRLDALQ